MGKAFELADQKATSANCECLMFDHDVDNCRIQDDVILSSVVIVVLAFTELCHTPVPLRGRQGSHLKMIIGMGTG